VRYLSALSAGHTVFVRSVDVTLLLLLPCSYAFELAAFAVAWKPSLSRSLFALFGRISGFRKAVAAQLRVTFAHFDVASVSFDRCRWTKEQCPRSPSVFSHTIDTTNYRGYGLGQQQFPTDCQPYQFPFDIPQGTPSVLACGASAHN
jgi:hypothetical protein